MKILIVSNLYPPYFRSGNDIRCGQVAEALQASGHEVCVLTSVFGLPLSRLRTIQPTQDVRAGIKVLRHLNHYCSEPQPWNWPYTLCTAKRELWDVRQFMKVLREFQPDLVSWWGMYGFSKSLLPLPKLFGIPDVLWIEQPWLIEEYGRDGETVTQFWASLWEGMWGPKLLRPMLRFFGHLWERHIDGEGIPTSKARFSPRHVCYVSKYLQELHRKAGFHFPSEEVIHGGVPPVMFYQAVGERSSSELLRILWAGQLTPNRGLHTVVEAIGKLPLKSRSLVTLTVAGTGIGTYVASVKEGAQALGITGQVSFLDLVPHEKMPDLYKAHDVLVFASTRPEGIPLTMVEAMMAGCAVLTTGSGGAMEIAELANLPIFPKEDAVTLSRLLNDLVRDRAQVFEIAARGQKVALQEFSFSRMMGRVAPCLENVVRAAKPNIVQPAASSVMETIC